MIHSSILPLASWFLDYMISFFLKTKVIFLIMFPSAFPIFLFKKKMRRQKLHLLGMLVLSVLWELFMYPLRVELVLSYLATSHGLQISLDHV